MKKKVSIGQIYAKVGNLVILAALILVFSILAPTFLRLTNLLNVLRQVSMMAIVSVGFTLLLISGGLDLSVGSQIAIMNIITATMFSKMVATPIAVLLGCILTTVIGTINGIIVVKAKVPPMMATYGMSIALRGLSFIICGGMPIYTIPPSVKFLGQGLVGGVVPTQVILMIFIIIIGTIVLNRTYLGRYFCAVGSNAEATRLCGISTSKIQILAYAITGFLCGVAGTVMMGRVNSAQPSIADGFEMDVLTAVILGGVSINGGRGSVPRAMVGVLVIGILSNGMSLIGLNDYWQKLVKGMILIAVIIADSIRVQNEAKCVK